MSSHNVSYCSLLFVRFVYSKFCLSNCFSIHRLSVHINIDALRNTSPGAATNCLICLCSLVCLLNVLIPTKSIPPPHTVHSNCVTTNHFPSPYTSRYISLQPFLIPFAASLASMRALSLNIFTLSALMRWFHSSG